VPARRLSFAYPSLILRLSFAHPSLILRSSFAEGSGILNFEFWIGHKLQACASGRREAQAASLRQRRRNNFELGID